MDNKDPGKIMGPGIIQFQRLLPKPIERVWAYLTEPDKRAKWLAAGGMELRIGGAVTLVFLHSDLSADLAPVPERFKAMEKGYGFSGKVTRCSAPHLLAFTWDGNSEVVFELTDEEDHVKLILTHRKLSEDSETLINVISGWHTHLEILNDCLIGGNPQPFWRTFLARESQYRDEFSAQEGKGQRGR